MHGDQRLMTRAEFERFIATAQTKLFVRSPYALVPCQCGDINCHGWRFVEVRASVSDFTGTPAIDLGTPIGTFRGVLK
jgi:hypothetical protein